MGFRIPYDAASSWQNVPQPDGNLFTEHKPPLSLDLQWHSSLQGGLLCNWPQNLVFASPLPWFLWWDFGVTVCVGVDLAFPLDLESDQKQGPGISGMSVLVLRGERHVSSRG